MAKASDMKRAKYSRAHAKPCRILLPGGQTVRVDRFEMIQTYIGLIEGIPSKDHIESRIRAAETYVREHWKRPRIVVIPPDILDPSSDRPVLPTLTMMAQLSCLEPRDKSMHGSWLNVVWFTDIDDEKSIKDFVAEALEKVDWEREAEDFLF